MLTAVILAAGDSARMGRPKALLDYRGEFFIEAVRSALAGAGAGRIIAVLGRHSAEILGKWRPGGVTIAVNPRPEDGQLSSLRAGLSAAPEDSEAVMVCLADQPAIAQRTYREIISFWRKNKDAVVIPRVRRPVPQEAGGGPFKRGHPIIIPRARFKLCFDGPLDKGLHWVTHHASVKVLDLDVDDVNIARDVDTPEDYRKLTEGR